MSSRHRGLVTSALAFLAAYVAAKHESSPSVSHAPSLVFSHRRCDDDNSSPCSICEGDCDGDDSACGAGLKCFKRMGTEPVPGCAGEGKRKVDYCYRPENAGESPERRVDGLSLVSTRWCNEDNPCGECEGSCYDDDSVCGPGLRCFDRKRDEPVPGCNGWGPFGVDYCYRPEADESPGTALVNFGECDKDKPCGECEGDCDKDDSACGPGLRCFERKGDEEVPGCTGKGKKKVDYCYRPEADESPSNGENGPFLVSTGWCEEDEPCGECEGNCDKNDWLCGPGLLCFERKGDEAVPGCSGEGENKVHYCYDPNKGTSFDSLGQCHKDGPCSICQGDCDFDSDCYGHLKCFQRDKDGPVPGCFGRADQGMDYCYDPQQVDGSESMQPPVATSLTYVFDCNEEYQCGKCTGECEDDFGCASGLRCFERTDTEAVPGCTGEGDRGMSYCYDPADIGTPGETSAWPTKTPTDEPTLPPSTPPVDPSNIAPSSDPPVPSPSASDVSDPATAQMVVVPLSPMTMSLTFFVARRRLALSVIAVDEEELLRITENALTDSFSGVYSLFERVDLKMDSQDELLEVATNATASYGLNGSVQFVEAPNWKLPSPDDLGKLAMGTLGDDDFREMLQESRDPVLSSVHSVEVVLSAPELGEVNETMPAESRGSGSDVSNNDAAFKALLAVAIIVSCTAVLTLGIVLLRRKRSRGQKSVDNINLSPAAVKTMSSESQVLEHSAEGGILLSASVDESELSMGTWSNAKGFLPGSVQSAGVSTPGNHRDKKIPIKEEVGPNDDNRSQEGKNEDNHSISNRSNDPSIISYNTDGMSAIGMARMDTSIMDMAAYDDGTVATQDTDRGRLQEWLKKRREIEEQLNTTGEYSADEWLEKRQQIEEGLYSTEKSHAVDTLTNVQDDDALNVTKKGHTEVSTAIPHDGDNAQSYNDVGPTRESAGALEEVDELLDDTEEFQDEAGPTFDRSEM